mmetsp:Transcript_17741/g.32080  ORF Transcript_17741/g.32080 Transcript_17741/m.32080 type:complete len:387 (-) Transcript_17741:8-1168(-)
MSTQVDEMSDQRERIPDDGNDDDDLPKRIVEDPPPPLHCNMDHHPIVIIGSRNACGCSCSGWDRWRWEWTRPLFFLEEPCGSQIDVGQSFAPPRRSVIWIRACLLLWSLQVLSVDLWTYPPHNLYIYMGYLTHWGHVLSIFYFFTSFLCALLRLPHPQKQQQQHPQLPWLVRLTWGLYGVVSPLGVAIALLYWGAIANYSGDDPPISYPTLMEHGVVTCGVWLDGAVIGKIPVRAKHVWFLQGVCVTYLLWSILDIVFEIGGGEWGPAYNSEDDDAVYPVLKWRNETKAACIVSAFCICGLAPTLFLGCWILPFLLQQRPRPQPPQVSSTATGWRGLCYYFANPSFSSVSFWDGSLRPLYQMEDFNISSENAELDYKQMMDRAQMT